MAHEILSLPFGPRPVPAKQCKLCRETKPLTEFHGRYGGTRHRAECKECYRVAKRARVDPIENRRRASEWAKANPEKHRQHGRQNYERRRSDVVRWLASNLRTTRDYCKRKGLAIDITPSDLGALFKAQDGRCGLTGRGLIYGSKGQQRDSISIDRIEPSLGYVLGNVRLVTYQANMSRGQFSDDELFAFCDAVLTTRAKVTA